MERHLPFFRARVDDVMSASYPSFAPTIATRRLLLRQPDDGDIADIVAGIGDPAVARMLARVSLPYTRADARAFLATARVNARTRRAFNLSIVHDGRVIGGIAIESLPAWCEFGYWLARPAWGHGFATEAGRAALAYGFVVLALRLVRSGVFADNPASMRVQKKLGFAVTGRSTRRSLARHRVVAHIDTVLTRRRFEALPR